MTVKKEQYIYIYMNVIKLLLLTIKNKRIDV